MYFPPLGLASFYVSLSVARFDTYIRPEARKPSRNASVSPLFESITRRIYTVPPIFGWEVVLDGFDDERGVAVDLATNCQNRYLAIGNPKRL